jgi:uncharacterized protein YcbK (DUF882 family)
VPVPAVAHTLPPAKDRRLSFYNLHTGERLDTLYWSRGDYVAKGLRRINHILRDFRTGEVESIDVRLLDALYELRRRVDSRQPFHVISGYRSPKTNAMLVSQSNGGVAKKSYHLRGMAIDLRLPERDLAQLRRTAMDMQRGGVGYYPSSGFIHVDVGPVRYW